MENFSTCWFDSHCHFDFEAFDSQRETIWQQAQQAGVAGLLIPGVSLRQSARLAEFCSGKPWFYAFGLHPYFHEQHQADDVQVLRQLVDSHKPLAIGEIGLDWTLAKRSADPTQQRQLQWQLFEQQVMLAEQTNLPLILHIRGAHDEAASWLKKRGFSGAGIVHAFSGSVQQGQRWLELGFKLGIGGAMTFPRANKLRTTIKTLPLSSWLLETDAPDMRPAFLSSQAVNSPLSIPLYGQLLASLTGRNTTAVQQQCRDNLVDVFPRLSGF